MTINVVSKPRHKKKCGFWLDFLQKFMESPNRCVEIIIGPEDSYVDARSLQGTILMSIKRYHLGGLHTIAYADRVYLFKEG